MTILKNHIPSVQILTSKVHLVNEVELQTFIELIVNEGKQSRIGNINIHAANLAFETKWFRDYMNSCGLVFCDGKGIQLASWITRQPIPPHITYHTWIWSLAKFCQDKQFSLFFLGSGQGVAELAINRIKEKFPNIELNGHHGYFEKSGLENQQVIDLINKWNPNILIVGFGMPLQEKWILDNKDQLHVNIILNGGAFLEWISQIKEQSPPILTKIGLEWLFRFFQEPKRLFKRYIIGNPLFMLRLMFNSKGRE